MAATERSWTCAGTSCQRGEGPGGGGSRDNPALVARDTCPALRARADCWQWAVGHVRQQVAAQSNKRQSACSAQQHAYLNPRPPALARPAQLGVRHLQRRPAAGRRAAAPQLPAGAGGRVHAGPGGGGGLRHREDRLRVSYAAGRGLHGRGLGGGRAEGPCVPGAAAQPISRCRLPPASAAPCDPFPSPPPRPASWQYHVRVPCAPPAARLCAARLL